MGLWQRFTLIFKAKANKALDKAEDPRETLDYSYEKQLELLQKVRRGVADVATSRKRLELQMQGLTQQSDKLEQQARAALAGGREDLAREALTRRSGLQQQIADLQTQFATLQDQEEKLTLASQRLQAKVESFRTKKETIKATYSAAEAQTKINEAFSGISEELGDVGLAIQRAEDKTAQMQARAGAIDELLASGALDDPTGLSKDNLTLELERHGQQHRRRHPAGRHEVPDRRPRRHPRNRAVVGDPAGARNRDREGVREATMIVRIQGEGQFRLPDDAMEQINAADTMVESALNSPLGGFRAAYDGLLDLVRRLGTPLDPADIAESDVILPPADSTEEEVRDLLTGEGLVPG